MPKVEGTMKYSILAMMIVGCLALAGNAVALERWDFGRLAYGSKVTERPTWARDWDCSEGCSFKDDLGVEYQTWEEDEIVLKTFTVSSGNHQQIPFGIDYNADTQSVLKTVKAKTGKILECTHLENNPELGTGVLLCDAEVIAGDPGVSLHVIFDASGKLTKIEIWTHYV
jgi:hypothetical protein